MKLLSVRTTKTQTKTTLIGEFFLKNNTDRRKKLLKQQHILYPKVIEENYESKNKKKL
jgi:hypothetical protein